MLLGTREGSLTHDKSLGGRNVNYTAPGQEGLLSPLSSACI